jgi:hypothetical protein
MQVYEHHPDEDNAPGWKANIYPRRKVHKGWLVAVVLSAALFFVAGIKVSTWTLPVPAFREVHSSVAQQVVSKSAPAVQPPASQTLTWPPAHTFYYYMNPTFTAIATNEVAKALHLTPQQVTTRIVNDNYGLGAVAADQRIGNKQLFLVEQQAVDDMLNAEIQAGYIHPEEAPAWKASFWNDPGKLDNVVGSMFSGYPVNIGY